MKVARATLVAMVVFLLGAPWAAEPQETRVYRIGFLLQGSPPPPGAKPGALRVALSDLGYIEGRNLVVEFRWAEGKAERFPRLASELVALGLDTIIADTTAGSLAVKHATATIPIVMINVSDPVGSGLVTSLARPGGNVTGVTDFGSELAVKAVDLVHTAVPKATRIAVLMSDNPVHPSQLRLIQDASHKLGLTVLPTRVTALAEFEEAFRSIAKQNAGALILLGGAPFSTERQRDKLVELAAKARLPAMYPSRWWTDAGGLLSYGPSSVHRNRLAAAYVDRILKGARPADLPVQQPNEFELVINLKAARALGLALPPTLLQRADQVIGLTVTPTATPAVSR
jgi:putative ABC transport system substrate-binding protein